ncbi:hypothetical protein C8R43DRAFT_1140118 [Mycena crocata]|nr:hypothetical protein C8R43DRAFT_1140118 [Mycena crocata]
MARTKKAAIKKEKEMFQPYDPDTVPDIMPFPSVALVKSTKAQEVTVPKLNEHQRSWILDVGVRGLDLPSLKGKIAKGTYEEIKNDVFDQKAFKHRERPEDRDEEAKLPTLVADWKAKQRERKKKSGKSVEESDSDNEEEEEEEDEGGRAALLRGYTKAGWRLAIQKVISAADGAGAGGPTPAERTALSKLLGLAAYTGRDKFRDDRHDVIHEYSKTLPGANPGGKFRKAEGLLWGKEDRAAWEAAAVTEENVDWAERQKLVPSGFKNMVDTLHASGKFRPFMATMLMAWLSEDGKVHMEAEAVPEDIRVRQAFKTEYAQLVDDSVNKMYKWAERPLTEYASARASKSQAVVFTISIEDLEEKSPKEIMQAVSTFLAQSYYIVFGAEDIPWAAIAVAPEEYYDVDNFPAGFASTGLEAFTRAQWYDLAQILASIAGPGTSGFFRKRSVTVASPVPSRSPSPMLPPPPRSPLQPATASPAPSRSPSPAPPPGSPLRPSPAPSRSPSPMPPPLRSPPPPSPSRSPSPTPPPHSPPRPATSPPPPPGPPAGPPLGPPPAEKKKRGTKRKAEAELFPEPEAGASTARPARARKTPAEAAELARQKVKASTSGKAKPGWEYVERSPVKAKGRGSGKRDSRNSRGIDFIGFPADKVTDAAGEAGRNILPSRPMSSKFVIVTSVSRAELHAAPALTGTMPVAYQAAQVASSNRFVQLHLHTSPHLQQHALFVFISKLQLPI